MADSTVTLTLKPEIEGIGDADTRTIDPEVANTIAELVKQNLRNRYAGIEDEPMNIVCVSEGNSVAVHFPEREND